MEIFELFATRFTGLIVGVALVLFGLWGGSAFATLFGLIIIGASIVYILAARRNDDRG